MTEALARKEYLLPYTREIAFPVKPMLTDGGGMSKAVVEELIETEWVPSLKKADRLDYAVAVCSGVLTGLLDVFYVGNFSFEDASKWGGEQVEAFVRAVAKHADNFEAKDIKDVIRHLEENHHMAADGVQSEFGGGLHHFRDFSHHFSITGLAFSVFTQFSGRVVGTDINGSLLVVPVPDSHRKYLGKTVIEKIAFGTIEWLYHMASDMAGSSAALDGGKGIPGPVLSLLKDLSALPFFKDATDKEMGFRLWLAKLYNGTLLLRKDENGKPVKQRFDLRAEIGVFHELGKQATPVLLNQAIVRAFYFARCLASEMKSLNIRAIKDLEQIAPEDVLPFNNGRVLRMVTVASGVFEAVDLSDAAVRAAIKAGKAKNPTLFLGEFIVRVNFVGIGTFAVACALDIKSVRAEKKAGRPASLEEALDKELSEFGCLILDAEKVRLLHSLQRSIILSDIAESPKAKRNARKTAWLEEWEHSLLESLGLDTKDKEEYFLNNPSLYSYFDSVDSDANEAWPYLVALEGLCFKPYFPLYKSKENDKEYKGLKENGKYMEQIFCKMQSVVDKDDITGLKKALDKAGGSLDSAGTIRTAGLVGTVVLVAASGGVAFAFAPAIAPAIAAAISGEVVAGLSGAALTSASLALLGGGSLAAGGAGMAGGVAVIAGGGALLGAVGGSGVSAVTAMALSSSGYVLEECTKLLAFSRDVLLGKLHDVGSVLAIQSKLNVRIVELDIQIESLRQADEGMLLLDGSVKKKGEKKEEPLSPKKVAKILAKSRNCLQRCNSELSRAITIERKVQEKQR